MRPPFAPIAPSILLALAATGASLLAAPRAVAGPTAEVGSAAQDVAPNHASALESAESASPTSTPEPASSPEPALHEAPRLTQRWGLVDDGAAMTLGTAAFRLQSGGSFQRDAIYGEIHPSCALLSCEGEPRSLLPTWDGLKLASTGLAFAAVGVGATWLVAAPSERLGVSSIEIKLTTGGTTGLTLIGRF